MAIRLRDLKTEARNLTRAGQTAAALAAHDQMLAANPLDDDSRRKVGDLLFALGDRDGAIEVRRAVAAHDIRAGHPLPALVACKLLEAEGQDATDLLRLAAGQYSHDSAALARFAARQAPVDLDGAIAPLDPASVRDVAALMRRARDRALDLSVFVQYPQQFLPIAFFSELPAELFAPAVRSARLHRAPDGAVVIKEREPGRSFFFVAGGEVRVVARGPGGKAVDRGTLFEGALFGEMALVTEQPRTASVQVVGEADLLEVDRDWVARLRAEVPALDERLARFARERLLKNLLATSPLFKPFDQQQQMELIKRFEGHEVEPGTVVIREGEAGQGLFVILMGEVEVLRHEPSGDEKLVARLGAGDVFGEMALLNDRPTTATVRAVNPVAILFLGREYFRRLVDAVPALRQYFEELSRQRRR